MAYLYPVSTLLYSTECTLLDGLLSAKGTIKKGKENEIPPLLHHHQFRGKFLDPPSLLFYNARLWMAPSTRSIVIYSSTLSLHCTRHSESPPRSISCSRWFCNTVFLQSLPRQLLLIKYDFNLTLAHMNHTRMTLHYFLRLRSASSKNRGK